MEEKRKFAWQIKKEVSIGDLIAFSVVAFAVITAYFHLDKRVALLEDGQIRQTLLDKAQDIDRSLVRVELRARLDRLEDKIDMLIGHSTKK